MVDTTNLSIVNINDLPLVTSDDLLATDKFLVVNDGVTSIITRSQLYANIEPLVKGDKGDTGLTGAKGDKMQGRSKVWSRCCVP